MDRRRVQAGGVLLAGTLLVGAALAISGGGDAAAPASPSSTLPPSTSPSTTAEPTAAAAVPTSQLVASGGAAAVVPESDPAAVADPADSVDDDARYGEEVFDQVELDEATVPEDAKQPSRPVNVPLGDERSCPLGGPFEHWYDWLAPRAGGNIHLGHDLIADTGTPVLAVSDAYVVRVDRQDTYAGGMADRQGVAVAIVTAQGERFFYAHLADIAPQLTPGSPVVTGQVIGWVGQTGDARMSVPHLHLEWRPDGRVHADPQTLVSELCANPVG